MIFYRAPYSNIQFNISGGSSMKEMRKLFSLLLAVAMVISLLPSNQLTAFAASKTTSSNTCTVYYYNNNFNNVNIHYGIDNSWTSVPGVAMEQSTEQSGYAWKYVIDLGSASSVAVCFNNGSTWDSQNGSNYNLSAGTYGIKNGSITELTPVNEALQITDVSIDKGTIINYGDTANVTVGIKGGVAPYSYSVYATLASGVTNGIISTDGQDKTTVSGQWKPTQISDSANLHVYIRDAEGTVVEKDVACKVVDPQATNKLTIYYNNSSYSSAYIHYCVDNGEWTSVPGVAMEQSSEQSGYTWKYVIDLGTKTTAEVCFNNGNGSWDSLNGANYDLTYTSNKNIFGIKDGEVIELSDVVPQNRRALVLGETSTSAVPILDVTSMVSMMENSTFSNNNMTEVVQYNDRTKAQITNEIKSLFSNNTENDVSYIYFTCHGSSSGGIYIGSDGTCYTPAELRLLLDENVKGSVVLMIDCCYAANAIKEDMPDSDANFADSFMDSFISEDVTTKSGELANEKYHVICACDKTETASGGTSSLATRYWELGCGWDELNAASTSLNADSNADNQVTMSEVYTYSYPRILSQNSSQHIVVYPENDNFTVFGRY